MFWCTMCKELLAAGVKRPLARPSGASADGSQVMAPGASDGKVATPERSAEAPRAASAEPVARDSSVPRTRAAVTPRVAYTSPVTRVPCKVLAMEPVLARSPQVWRPVVQGAATPPVATSWVETLRNSCGASSSLFFFF